MKAVMKFLSVKDPKSMTPVAAIYKENGDFEKVLHILHQDVDTVFDPWYIGYGMDDDKGHNRNLSTIYTI
jgi:hypoxanthine-guanine phosphoribosyltransferase